MSTLIQKLAALCESIEIKGDVTKLVAQGEKCAEVHALLQADGVTYDSENVGWMAKQMFFARTGEVI